MENNVFNKYFLGAATADGYISYFPECYDWRSGWKTYIIKGGPGTGKSTLMKKIAARAKELGMSLELCPCSSDPESLDAVLLCEQKIAVLDGTAPHVVEPRLPGACEEIVNLGEAFKIGAFVGKEKELLRLSEQNSACHQTAARYLSAAGRLLADARRMVRDTVRSERVVKFAVSTAKRLIPNRTGIDMGKEIRRFVSSPTSKGCLFFDGSLKAMCRSATVIEDEYRAVAPLIISIIKDYAISRGYDVITLFNPYLPDKVMDHILIPELSIGILTHSRTTDLSSIYSGRMIHSRRFTDINQLKSRKKRISFDRKAATELIRAACTAVSEAKLIHDQIEKHYINAMDFEKAEIIGDQLIEKIF